MQEEIGFGGSWAELLELRLASELDEAKGCYYASRAVSKLVKWGETLDRWFCKLGTSFFGVVSMDEMSLPLELIEGATADNGDRMFGMVDCREIMDRLASD